MASWNLGGGGGGGGGRDKTENADDIYKINPDRDGNSSMNRNDSYLANSEIHEIACDRFVTGKPSRKQHHSLLLACSVLLIFILHLDTSSALSLHDMPTALIGRAEGENRQQHWLLAPTIAGGIATA
eukprot:119208-Hanusia_phi.AAC.1